MKYVALLRGINVGGNKKVPMAVLKSTMEKAGFTDVRTLLNSGNVLFVSAEKPATAQEHLANVIQKQFGFDVPVLLRTHAEIVALTKAQPFKGVPVDADTRLYISFLDAKPKSSLKIPYVSPDKSFTILAVQGAEIISVLRLSAGGGTSEAMGVLEKEFNKNITTRNWNTVEKIAAL